MKHLFVIVSVCFGVFCFYYHVYSEMSGSFFLQIKECG